ncbi:xylulokinase [Rugosimonospora acidiphila]|uniref:Xylulose kinase n=1 Tax=Rugosimonospora acidiphila TaxID=556531 RepID=A0ABP9SFP5_9ACTN
MSTLVAGVDSSTQSCKVVIRDAQTGTLVREGRAAHPDGTEVHPDAWWHALTEAVRQAGGLDDVAAVAVGAQQHGMVCLDEAGQVIRPALLWNDTRSAGAAQDLVAEFGGPGYWAEAVGSVPLASFTVTKLRWLAQHEPESARRVHTVCLPHDWLTWRLAGGGDPSSVRTDRGDASGTGYWSPATGQYRPDLLRAALGRDAAVPAVLGPAQEAGRTAGGAVLGPGTGDNAAAALGIGALPGDVVVSIGTSGTVFTAAAAPSADASGIVAGFADATGGFLPLVCTLNASRVLDASAALLGVDLDTFADLALSAPPGADGLVLVPYLEGERTPNRPLAAGSLHGLRHGTMDPAHLARAAVEGMLCALADGLDALLAGGVECRRVILVGGGARSAAVRAIAPTIFGVSVLVPPPGEYVADGAARQAAWVRSGSEAPPTWTIGSTERYQADPVPAVRQRYAEAAGLVLDRPIDRPVPDPAGLAATLRGRPARPLWARNPARGKTGLYSTNHPVLRSEIRSSHLNCLKTHTPAFGLVGFGGMVEVPAVINGREGLPRPRSASRWPRMGPWRCSRSGRPPSQYDLCVVSTRQSTSPYGWNRRGWVWKETP